MGRGLLSGLFWGGAASMVALIVASVYFPMRDLVDRQQQAAATQQNAPAEPTPATDLPRVSEERVILADPPPPPPGAQVADAPPPEPQVPEPATPAPELAARPADPTLPRSAPARPQPPSVPDMAQQAPAASTPARLTTVPDVAAAPVEPPRGDPGAQARAETAPRVAQAALPSPRAPGLSPAPRAIAPAPPAGAPPNAEAAPSPAVLPVPDAAGIAAEPVPDQPAATPVAPDLQLAALPNPPAEVPVRPVALGTPSAPGRAPVPDLGAIAVPATPVETPLADVRAAQSAPAPAPASLTPFDAPDTRTAPAPPGLRLAALTQPIVGLPPAPRAVVPQTPGTPPAPAAPAPGATAPEPDPAPEDRFAGLQPPTPPATSPGSLPRRIVVGGGTDGVSRLGANRVGGGTRFPQIGVTDPEAAPAASAEAPQDLPEVPVGALARNAQPWTGAGPRAAIVLQATSPERSVTDILAGIDAPLAVALDPSWLEAPQRAQALTAAGHEVLIVLTGLPPQPRPRDIDVALNSHIARLPEAVGVLLPPGSPVLDDRALLTQLAGRLAETGHGLIAQPRGLNALAQVARAQGTALAPVNTVLPTRVAAAQTDRTLDRALFDASRQGTVVVLGETQADTLVALRDWARGSGGQLAPVSSILLEGS
ncbi:divergent polysaccharide deacetylase family protein [Tropicimonas sp. S265A]|uniref:divergent polysaccharide deacetylase family protein n=1 Tax=Tropicimonas sp. S265A TaxID=3415134 RepID=UPI003C7B36EB